jgi:PAS domain S-box-containing protein
MLGHESASDTNPPSHSEEALDAARDRLRFLGEALAPVADGVAVVDTTGRFVFVNDAGQRLTGREAAPDRGVLEQVAQLNLRHLDGRPLSAREMSLGQALEGEVTVEEVVLLTLPTGEDAYFSGTASPVRDEQGRIIGAYALFRDVSERERLAAQLRAERAQAESLAAAAQASATRLQAVIEHMSEAVSIWDPEGNLLGVNEEALRHLGCGREDLVERNMAELSAYFSLAYPDGREMPAAEWPLARVLRGENLVEYEVVVRQGATERSCATGKGSRCWPFLPVEMSLLAVALIESASASFPI